MKRVLAIILVAVMCLSAMPMLFVSTAAAETASIENLFESMGYGKPHGSDPFGDITRDYEYITGKAIAVTEGDIITMAPVIPDQGYLMLEYKSGGSGSKVKATNANATLTYLGDNPQYSPAIITYKVPAGVTHIAPVYSQMHLEYGILTKNQPLTKEMCFEMWKDINLNVIHTGTVARADDLVNLFSEGSGGLGVYPGEGSATEADGLGTNTFFRTTVMDIPVTRDDVVYFVGETPMLAYLDHCVSTFDETGKGIENYKHANISVYSDLGNGYVVYCYRPYPEAVSIRVTISQILYDMGFALMTKNQPFDGTVFRQWCKSNGVSYDAIGEDLDNLFGIKVLGGAGVLNAEGRSDLEAGYGSNTNYWCTEPIAVTENDTLYFVGESTIGYHVSLFDKDGKGLGKDTNVKPEALTVVEELGKVGDTVYNIYSYKPTAGVGYVRISQKAATYESKCVLLTKNQPFDKAMLVSWALYNGGDLDDLLKAEDVKETEPTTEPATTPVTDPATEPTTTPQVTKPQVTAPTTEPQKKSCGGFAGIAAVIAVGITVFGTAVTVIKKK